MDLNLDERLQATLAGDHRPPDGKLHCSGDLCSPMRHVMLKAVGAPSAEADMAALIRLRIGTDFHSYMERVLRGTLVMQEVKLDHWLPEGWSGTADAVLWSNERRGFVLLDFKTIKPEGLPFILKGGAKTEHLHQLSAYWAALVRAGLPMVQTFGVYYIPTGQTGPRDADVSPSMQWCKPYPQSYMDTLMISRWQKVSAYVAAVQSGDALDNDLLAPEPERVQKLMPAKRGVSRRDVCLVPQWYARYCPFAISGLCGCSQAGTTKIGHYEGDEYVPRVGFEAIDPTVTPRHADSSVEKG